MKEYFIQLFDYDKYANLLIADAITEAAGSDKSVALMAHLLSAQQIWLGRCKMQPATGVVLWPTDWDAAALRQVIQDNHRGWINYLEYLDAADFEQSLTYKSLAGDEFENKLKDILTHVINHGTHHRAQVGQILKFAGADKLPPTDYIFFLRETGN